jgi:quinol-cytochrome oxidoreductase complex cytochrome b subunit
MASGLETFMANIKALPRTMRESVVRHGTPNSDRTRSQAVFGNIFLHIHAVRTHPHSLKLTTTWALGISLVSQYVILLATGVLLMVYYKPSIELAYDSIKDLHYVVPTGRYIRNIHRWAAHMMVATCILHMARVFYTAAYKPPREFNWVMGMFLFVMTLLFSFTGYLLPWDQLAFWAITIGANIAASPNELAEALSLPKAFYLGDLVKEVLLGASTVGQEALTRFYVLHIIVLPLVFTAGLAIHMWRIRKDGGIARPEGNPTAAGKGAGPIASKMVTPALEPTKTYGLMAVVPDKSAYTGKDTDGTVPTWPFLFRAELLVFMVTLLICVALGVLFDAPLKEIANPNVPENPAKAPWYFLGLQEIVSYSAFVGGMVIPTIVIIGLALIPYLDRESEPAGQWFSWSHEKRVGRWSLLFGAIAAILSVAIPVQFGWLRNWFPGVPQIAIILVNPGSLLTLAYAAWSLFVLKRTGSTRLGAVALFTCFLVGFVILTYVGTYLRGPNWDFYWSQSQWPSH